MMNSSAWSSGGGDPHPGDDDFQQFLDMSLPNLPNSLGFDFNSHSHLYQSGPREQLDTAMDGTDMAPTDPSLQHRMPLTPSAAPYQTMAVNMMTPQTADETMVDNLEAQIRFLQQQKMQHQQQQQQRLEQAAYFTNHQRCVVPPTPPANTQFYGRDQSLAQPSLQQTPQLALDYRYRRIKDQQEIFTPLVSPAVTPLESQFPVDAQFGVGPSAYFSPLTSPALHAQTDQRPGAVAINSPDEMDLGASTPGSVAGSVLVETAAKKSRRNPSVTRTVKATVGKSPISRPQRRRTATTPNLQAMALSELAGKTEQGTQQQRLPPLTAAGTPDSENGSVSPHSLTDVTPIEMPPPPVPKPRSARPSPYMGPKTHGTPTMTNHGSSPATPASLMMLGSPAQGAAAVDTEHIETLELPGPMRPTHFAQSPVLGGTEQTSCRKPAFQPSPPVAISPQMLPTSASSSGARTKTPQLLSRGSNCSASTTASSKPKTRGSISSVHASPALRPKISPNIKPLLPSGATAEESASHLLATKSNYQRILEGNTVAGVSYPSELSTNLTSKRTSHKLAEQGRRNRINTALLEMALLLPRNTGDKDGKGGGSDDGEGSAGGGDRKGGAGGRDKDLPNSKARTVERAIEYIKQLKQEVAEANRRADEAERELTHRG